MLWYENFMLYICTLSTRCTHAINSELVSSKRKGKSPYFCYWKIDYNLTSTNTSCVTFIYNCLFYFSACLSIFTQIVTGAWKCGWAYQSECMEVSTIYTNLLCVLFLLNKTSTKWLLQVFVFEQVVFQCDRGCKVPHIWYMVANRNRRLHGISVTAYFIIIFAHQKVNILLES